MKICQYVDDGSVGRECT